MVSLPNTDGGGGRGPVSSARRAAAGNRELGPPSMSTGPGPWRCSGNRSPAELADPAAPAVLPHPLARSRPPPAVTDTDRVPVSSPKQRWQASQPGFLWPSPAGPGAAQGPGPGGLKKRKWGLWGVWERQAGVRRGPIPAPRAQSLRPVWPGDHAAAAQNPRTQSRPPRLARHSARSVGRVTSRSLFAEGGLMVGPRVL